MNKSNYETMATQIPSDPTEIAYAGDQEDRTSPTRGIAMRLSTVLLAGLVLGYHADHALAEGTISGSTTDGHITLAWEYDLEQGTGQLLIRNDDQTGWPSDWSLYLVGAIPTDATNLQFDDRVVTFEPCGHCVSAVPCPPIQLFALLPVKTETKITFELPDPSWDRSLGPTTLDYGFGKLVTGSGCSVFPIGSITDFVTVTPIKEACTTGDFDSDGDIDLQDFAKFQELFTGPK